MAWWNLQLRRRVQPDPKIDYSMAFAIPDTEAWWLAVHQTLEEAERETIENARRYSRDPNGCMAAVNAGEGVDLVRQKLIDKRNLALQRRLRGGELDAVQKSRA